MDRVCKDIYYTDLVINDVSCSEYNNVYFHSNEELNDIFSVVDARDKRVLTVIGSGDQAFYFYDRGASKVDLYDKNQLAVYYYYLRVWTIKYLSKFYPDEKINGDFIKSLLAFVEIHDSSEEAAYNYWNMYANKFSSIEVDELFYLGKDPYKNEILDLSRVKSKLHDLLSSIYYLDISLDVSSIEKKYDIIYVSNISDYLKNNEGVYARYCSNLESLLTTNGVIVASNVSYKNVNDIEKKVFKKKFDLKCMDRTIKRDTYSMFPGYIYTRK